MTTAVTHEDLRHGRLNIYRLTGCEANDLVDEYDRLRAENRHLRSLLARWYRCYQHEGSPLLHSETRDALGDVT